MTASNSDGWPLLPSFPQDILPNASIRTGYLLNFQRLQRLQRRLSRSPCTAPYHISVSPCSSVNAIELRTHLEQDVPADVEFARITVEVLQEMIGKYPIHFRDCVREVDQGVEPDDPIILIDKMIVMSLCKRSHGVAALGA